MEKGKFGIRLSFYAVAAFFFVLFGNLTVLTLLAGAVIFIEKDEWASRQVIQAILLSLFSSIVSFCFSVVSFMNWFGWADYGTSLYKIYSFWNRLESIVSYPVRILIYILTIVAIIKTSKGQDAGIPLASNFANWAYGKIEAKPAAPAQAAPTQAAGDVCANCGTPLNGAKFCSKCGTPAAK